MLNEAKKSLHQGNFQVSASQRFDEISVCSEREITHQSYRSIPGVEQHFSFPAEQIPEGASSKMIIEDLVDF